MNKYGIKVGSIFHARCSYEQTNNHFFQVVEIVGNETVKVKEIIPTIEKATSCGFLAENRTISFDDSITYPINEKSFYIKDNKNGDKKRISMSKYENKPCFKLNNYYKAYLVDNSKSFTVYESWYA